jgi:hypothetical protein
MVWSQLETLSWKNTSQKRAGEVALGVGPELNFQYYKKKGRKYLGINLTEEVKSSENYITE